MKEIKQKVFLGTELKLNINIEPTGTVTMDEYDFTIEVYCFSNRAIVFSKNEAIRIDESNYVILVDTNELGLGDLKCKVTAYIPDSDFGDGLRTEIVAIDTGINIVKSI